MIFFDTDDKIGPVMDAAVLAGGKSSRMNYIDKSTLIFKGKTFLETIVEKLEGFDNTLIISNRNPQDYPRLNAIFHKDLIPGIGPLGGIYTALKMSGSHRIFFTGCDMPLIKKVYIEEICSYSDCDLVFPAYREQPEMLFALYSDKCLNRLEEMVCNGEYKITGLLKDPSLKIKKIDVGKEFIDSLQNINTDRDFKRLADFFA